MIIDLSYIRREGEPVLVDKEWNGEGFKLHDAINSLRRPVHCIAEIFLSGERVSVVGRLKADVELICSRCLQCFTKSLRRKFKLEYWPDAEVDVQNEELALNYEDLDVGFYRDDKLDLSNVIGEQILLAIPMKTVCREDCEGLCGQCGVDLNRGDCRCERSYLDPRLTALKKLKGRLTNKQ